MKVLVVSLYYYPEVGAAPSRITNMAEGLQRLGHTVHVLTSLPNYPKGRIFEGYRGRLFKRESVNGVEVFRYWTYATVSANPLKRALGMFAFATTMSLFAFRFRLIRSYDRVIVQSPPLPVASQAMTLFRCLYHKKVILNVSDLWPLSAVELGALKPGSVMHKILLSLERRIYRHATAVQCQSNEIMEHIRGFRPEKRFFLYRNLQPCMVSRGFDERRKGKFRIVYAGLMGVAQNLLEIVRNVDFKSLNAELHLFGGGNQTQELCEYIKANDCAVYYHGYLDKAAMVAELSRYDASIVPLTVHIKGAVPSKIFDLMPVGIPILYCGEGEGAEIVREYGVGLVSAHKDFKKLEDNIAALSSLSREEYEGMCGSCLKAAGGDFSFSAQMDRWDRFLSDL